MQTGASNAIAPTPLDTNEPDSLPYPMNQGSNGGLYLNNPSNFTTEVVYDPVTGQYIIYERIGDLIAKPPMFMTPEEYREYIYQKQVNDYWSSKVESTSKANEDPNRSSAGLVPQIQVNSEAFGKVFGSDIIEIRPQGAAEIRFGGRYQKIENPALPVRNQKTFNFDFDQRIQMNVTGKIGDRLQLGINYDTEATFAFENKMKLEYEGDEDEIIKRLEMGNVNLPVNSSLITGAQSLFGVKGQFQFGKTTVTAVFSEQRSQSQSINVQGGGTLNEYEIWADQYEANRHFFLAQYFRDQYEKSLRTMPVINSTVQITRMEVWVTNERSSTQDLRNIVAFMDLGESESDAYRNNASNLPGYALYPAPVPNQFGYPNNQNNRLNPSTLAASIPGVRDIASVNGDLVANGFEEATEFIEIANARKLEPNQYSFHPQLGYITLNQALNQDEVLAVAYQYTANGRTFQVGEFSNDGVNPPNSLILKMLKSTILNVKIPLWDLMMKNVYSLGAFQVDREDFYLEIAYWNDETGVPIPFLPSGNLKNELLLRVMEMDRLNNNNDPQPDGIFDFVEGITINPRNGRIMFPVLEPFGSNLADKLDDPEDRDKYVFQQLYDSTRFRAQDQTQLNKYIIRGKYKSASGSEISLNAFNIPRGSVSVTAGGTKLVENQDYTVDYTLGRIKILNEGILNSGVPIQVNFENNTLFNVQTKTFMGATFDHRINKDFNIGGSILHLTERPLTQKTNIGDEPISNTIWGINGNYQTEAPILTRIVDAIPFIDTKVESRITAQGEVAHLIPGSPKGIKIAGSETTYIDDFESAQTTIDLRGLTQWQMASVPGGQPDLFPEASVNNALTYGYNRAKLSWYIIDPVFFANNAQTPENIRADKNITSDHRQREVLIQEVFPNYSLNNGQPRNIAMFDMAYYPNERGPYNFDVEGEAGISSGMDNNGELLDPETRWAGIMRPLTINNFEEQNIEFIQFWMLDPFLEDPNNPGGDLYFNLGSVSEDILKDGRQAFENGIDPVTGVTSLDSTAWGYVPKVQPITEFFDNDPGSRPIQDVGMDLLDDDAERNWSFSGSQTYLERVETAFGQGSTAYQKAFEDPAEDNFGFYKGPDLDANGANVLERYKDFNGMQGNSGTQTVDGVPASFTNVPDKEDVNRDQTLTKTESYYQYKVSIRKGDLTLDNKYITDVFETVVDVPNGTQKTARWIQFKIPIFTPDKRVGAISDFRSIRFMRMFMKNFNTPIVMRFARLDLVRGEWRRYRFSLDEIREDVPNDPTDQTAFAVNAVNLEENGNRDPVPYVLPPNIDRQVIFGASNLVQQNEQSLSLYTCDLRDGDARAVFRNLNFDMRMYGRMKMFIHGESAGELDDLDDDDLNIFVRIGSDYNQNFYEYEVPLKVTRWGSTEPYDIWPVDNEVDIDFNVLKQLKLERDRLIQNNPDLSRQIRYRKVINGREVSVVGSPNLGNVRTIMIGIRNPKKTSPQDPDDGLPKCAEVWVNELRLTDFDQRGGWAANGRVTAKLADFADISLSGNTSSIGFGSLDQSVQERNQFQALAYDLQSSFELGKFFSQESGVRIPLFFNYSEEWKNPMFNPLDPDIEFKDAVENLQQEGQRDSLRQASQDYVLRKNINFTNVRKERRGTRSKMPMPWNIENFSVSYAYSETFRRSINTVFDTKKDHRAGLIYTYQTRPQNVQPFKKVKSKYLTLIRDFNFYYLPSRFTFRTEFLRTNAEAQQRNTDNPLIQLPTTYFKSFTANRQYDLAFDLTKSLKLDYNARMDARIDELSGPARTDSNIAFIRDNLRSLGRPTRYHQTVNINWQVPINKLPYLDFVNLSARYSGDYDWITNSTRAINPNDSDLYFGNTLQNGNTIQINSTLNMLTLYNNIPYLQRINSGQSGKRQEQRQRQPARRQTRLEEESTEEGKSNEDGADGEPDKDKDKKPGIGQKILASTFRFMMMVRNVSLSYSQNNGMSLPGYTLQPQYFGMSPSGNWAPGPAFGFGFSQNESLARSLSENGFITRNTNQPNRFEKTFTENLNFRATVEPIPDMRIEITATKVNAINNSSIYRYHNANIDTTLGRATGYYFFNPMQTGNYSISFLPISSSFERSSLANGYSSDVFNQFLAYREILSERLAKERAALNPNYVDSLITLPNDTTGGQRVGYDGYSYLSQDVMLPAFLAAYGGYDPNTIGKNARPSLPMPNWQLNYSGLMKMEFFKKHFQTFTVSHGYRSLYTMSSFITNLQRQQREDLNQPGDDFRNENGDFMPELQVASVTISENFSPLIGVNVRMKNNTSLKVEVKRDRMLNLSITNNQLTEMKGTEVVIGAGYIVKDLKLRFIRVGANRKPVQSNLELKLDFSLRDNQTVIRRIFEDLTQVTAGQNVYSIKLSADYQINSRITARLYYDQILSKFKTSNAFPTNNLNTGISIRFNLGQ
jgi:cell surface protein SprA